MTAQTDLPSPRPAAPIAPPGPSPVAQGSALLSTPLLPRHVAIIMDGNGRWAEARGRARTEGHAKGADAVRETVRAFRKQGVGYLTLYAFSVANWQRPPAEVEALMHLLAHFAEQEKYELRDQGIRLNVVGNIAELPAGARRSLESAMEYTVSGSDMVLSLALSYGARKDIVGAARVLAQKVKAGTLNPEDINETLLAQEMSTGSLPAVDLLIRTGGESRISDFLLFESAYAELLFTPVMWPDFGERSVQEAIAHFAQRERRFGLTSGQLSSPQISVPDSGLNLSEARYSSSRSVPFAAEAE
jgi:undecaprenyl diphosphate synthase